MKRAYLAVGHGKRPDGRFDPGAIGPKGEKEHDYAHLVVEMIANRLKGTAGLELTVERNSGNDEDPNYVGSTANVNKGNYDVALSIHLDWSKAPRGGFGLYFSQEGLKLATHIRDRYSVRGLPVRGNTRRDDLYFLKRTNCPAVIWETDRIGAPTSEEFVKMADSIALGLAAYLGVTAPPDPSAPKPAPAPAPKPEPKPAPATFEEQVLASLQRIEKRLS